MVLLLTTDGDTSVDIVIDWLNYFQHSFIRINSIDLIRKEFKLEIREKEAHLVLGATRISFNDIGAIWYRKFGFFNQSEEYLASTFCVSPYILDHICREYQIVLDTIARLLSHKFWLTSPFRANVNKPYCMLVASQCGLSIPDTYVLNDKSLLGGVADRHEIISKSIKDGVSFAGPQSSEFTMFTTEVKATDIANITDRFIPSLVQEKIEKEYELRVFYLMGKCYSMAIFSQRDDQTKLDFRQYNLDKPNRNVPYHLPAAVRKGIRRLMKSMQLNCGSLDLMKGTDGEYYFLEINSTGQFGMVDIPNNYGLHRKVAETLIKFDKKHHEKISRAN
jgi:ATP-GRASP peptide maturase of grasp-with-spasm system